jgi:hypothetical protein
MKQLFFSMLVIVILLMAGCGPTAEEVATMTAAAWTPTPLPTATPTFTPTPVPYDLTVKVTDQAGNPIPGARVVLPESGDDTPVVADNGGQVTWTNLPGESGILDVTAQGYLRAQVSLSLERGPNEVTVTLEGDPLGLLPADACAVGETLVYAEDFQDSKADGWPEIKFNAPGWSLESDPLDSANLVVSAQFAEAAGGGPVNAHLEDYVLENGVWRMKFLVGGNLTGQNWFSFNWLHAREPFNLEGTEVFDSRYQLPMGNNYFEMRRLQQPLTNFSVGRGFRYPKAGEWHFLEIGTYQGNTEVWVDGVLTMGYEDPIPLPAGGIDLEVWLFDDGATLYFDNISLCELSEPFVPIPTATPAP